MEIRRRVFQAKGIASAAALGWEHACCFQGTALCCNEEKVVGSEAKERSVGHHLLCTGTL